MTIAQEFAAFCLRAASAPLPVAVAARARLCVADHLHAALLGGRSETGELARRCAGLHGSENPETAAFLLGALSAVYEIDDVHRDTSMHTGSVVVATALGAAHGRRVPDECLLRAVALGYEAAIRLSMAAGERHYHYFHATATCGTIAAAVTAGTIFCLDEDQLARAMGLAATMAAGLWEGLNTTAIGVKHLHSGFAAERGVRAATLALLGAAAAPEALEGPKGFLAALARHHPSYPRETPPTKEALREIMLEGLGGRWTILRNIFKRYPFCLGCFEPLECLRRILADETRPPEKAHAVRIDMYPPVAALVGRSEPRTPLQAKFSAPFALALLLTGRNPENARLPTAWLEDPAVRRCCSLITCAADPLLKPRTARVSVTWDDGAVSSAEEPLRDLEPEGVLSRFTAICRESAGPAASQVERRVKQIGSAPDVSDLLHHIFDALGFPKNV